MTANEFAEHIADLLTLTCKKVHRPEPLTWNELDTLADRIMLFIEDEKAKVQKEKS